MRLLLFKLMEMFPITEVWARKLYKLLNKHRKSMKRLANGRNIVVDKKPHLFADIINAVKSLGVEKGDILIVHSSMDRLKAVDAVPNQYIDALLELVGQEGTLVFPAFPHFRDQDKYKNGPEELYIYNPKKTPSWTGLLPNVFCRYSGVIRSECPFNPLAALGKHAQEMFSGELLDDLAHGKASAWAYCVDKRAKILYLGLNVTDADTIVHVAEDVMDEEWPIHDWYEKKSFLVKRSTGDQVITIRCRRAFWHQYFTAQYSGRIIRKNGFIKERTVEGIPVGLIGDSKEFVSFLIEQARHRKLFYQIPNKYWKK